MTSVTRCDLQKSRRRRNRKKKKKRNQEKLEQVEARKGESEKEKEKEKDPGVEIEYVTEEPEIYDPNFIFFKRIFEAFKVSVHHAEELTLKPTFQRTCRSSPRCQGDILPGSDGFYTLSPVDR